MMLTTKSKASQRGLTLVELMIAVALGIFLVWGALQAFLTGKRTYSMQEALSRIQENTRLAQETLGFDIRSAGNFGCVSGKYVATGPATTADPDPSNLLLNKTKAEFNINNTVFGANDVSGAANGDMNLNLPLSPVPVAGTDILLVHTGVDTGRNVLSMGPGSISMPPAPAVPTTGMFYMNNDGSVQMGDVVAITDCTKMMIFTPASVSAAGMFAQINGAFPYAPNEGSTIMRLDAVVYYIGINPNGRRSLYRRVNQGTSEELLQGVEDMQLQFGVDSAGNDGEVDSFTTADNVTAEQWMAWFQGGKLASTYQNVVAVRFSLLMSSDEQLLEAPKQYTYNGAATTAPDRRIYQVVDGTIAIRSRLN